MRPPAPGLLAPAPPVQAGRAVARSGRNAAAAARLPACLLAVLLATACTVSDRRPAHHERTGLGIRVLGAGSLRGNRLDPAQPFGGSLDLSTEAAGVHAETFSEPDVSVVFALERRRYDTRSIRARALEFRCGARLYLLERLPVQPYLTGVTMVGGMDIAHTDGLDYSTGAALGGGVAVFPARSLGLTAEALYEGVVVSPSVRTGPDGGDELFTEEEIWGWSIQFQLTWYF